MCLSLWFDDDGPDAAAIAAAMELLKDFMLSIFEEIESGGEAGGLSRSDCCCKDILLLLFIMLSGLLTLAADADAELVDAKGDS